MPVCAVMTDCPHEAESTWPYTHVVMPVCAVMTDCPHEAESTWPYTHVVIQERPLYSTL
jgi:hypothetical protein